MTTLFTINSTWTKKHSVDILFYFSGLSKMTSQEARDPRPPFFISAQPPSALNCTGNLKTPTDPVWVCVIWPRIICVCLFMCIDTFLTCNLPFRHHGQDYNSTLTTILISTWYQEVEWGTPTTHTIYEREKIQHVRVTYDAQNKNASAVVGYKTWRVTYDAQIKNASAVVGYEYTRYTAVKTACSPSVQFTMTSSRQVQHENKNARLARQLKKTTQQHQQSPCYLVHHCSCSTSSEKRA